MHAIYEGLRRRKSNPRRIYARYQNRLAVNGLCKCLGNVDTMSLIIELRMGGCHLAGRITGISVGDREENTGGEGRCDALRCVSPWEAENSSKSRQRGKIHEGTRHLQLSSPTQETSSPCTPKLLRNLRLCNIVSGLPWNLLMR